MTSQKLYRKDKVVKERRKENRDKRENVWMNNGPSQGRTFAASIIRVPFARNLEDSLFVGRGFIRF